MIFSHTAERKGWSNQPKGEALDNLKKTAELLEAIRTVVGVPIFVTSGYRSLQVNQHIGGAVNSAHMDGRAADIVAPPFTAYDLAERIVISKIPFDKVILEFGRWVHVQWSDSPRGRILTAFHGENGTQYHEGLT